MSEITSWKEEIKEERYEYTWTEKEKAKLARYDLKLPNYGGLERNRKVSRRRLEFGAPPRPRPTQDHCPRQRKTSISLVVRQQAARRKRGFMDVRDRMGGISSSTPKDGGVFRFFFWSCDFVIFGSSSTKKELPEDVDNTNRKVSARQWINNAKEDKKTYEWKEVTLHDIPQD